MVTTFYYELLNIHTLLLATEYVNKFGKQLCIHVYVAIIH